VAPGETHQAREIGELGDRALRIRGRGDEESDGAREQLLGERVEIGKKTGGGGGRQVDRLAVGRYRARGVGGVERVGDEHRGPAAAPADETRGGDGGEKQSLARAVEHENFARGIDRPWQREAAPEPVGGGPAEVVEPLVHGVAAELVDMGREDGGDEGRNGMLRLAHGEADCRLAGLGGAKELAQPHEGRAAEVGAGGRGRGLAFGGGHVHR